MKITLKKLIASSSVPASLIRAVVRQMGGWETFTNYAPDITRHGINGGFVGFTYYSDTVPFFKRNRAVICQLVNNQASDLGENPAEMVAGFGCIAGHASREDYDYNGRMTEKRRAELAEWMPDVSRCLYGGRINGDDNTVPNALAWFAAEEVARAYCDLTEQN